MIKEEFGIGATIEEAKNQAVSKLNCGDADYQIEIIEDVKPKILGLFGGHPAKVRAYYECPDPKPTKKAKNNKKQDSKKSKSKKDSPAQKTDKESEVAPQLNYVDLKDIDPNSPVAHSANYLITVLGKMGIEDISVKVAETPDGAHLSLEGSNLGVIIGRRGETLDALQYLASFATNARQSGGYYRVVLDIGNYREKREETLKALARRMSASAIRSGRNRSLEPMNPYERRIIHTEVQSIEGVSSFSVGDGDRRHVVIQPEGASRGGRYDRGGRGRGRNGGRTGKPDNKVEAPVREPKSDYEGETPLYGRIG